MATNQALDYSAGFPGAGNIRGAGYRGAVRYIGFPDRRKCTNAGELADFGNNGIGMALVYQDGTGDFTGGFPAGQTNARRARGHADAMGFPGGRPLYMAIDRDLVTAGDFNTAMAYLNGAASVLGRDQTGVYGEHDVIANALQGGHARYGWQTAAWSGDRRYPGAHLYQRRGTVHVGGVACDVNEILAADWGQHDMGGTTMTPDQETRLLKDTARIKEYLDVFNAAYPGGVDRFARDMREAVLRVRSVHSGAFLPVDGGPGGDLAFLDVKLLELLAAMITKLDTVMVPAGASPEVMLAALKAAFASLRITTQVA